MYCLTLVNMEAGGGDGFQEATFDIIDNASGGEGF
jgi:hypothetical protein